MYVKKLSGRTHDGQSHSNAERVRNISMWKKCAHVQVKFNCKETKPKHLYFYLMWCLYQLFLLFCGMPTFHLRCCEELIIWRWVSTLFSKPKCACNEYDCICLLQKALWDRVVFLWHSSHTKCEKANENTGPKHCFELRGSEREGNLLFSSDCSPTNSS